MSGLLQPDNGAALLTHREETPPSPNIEICATDVAARRRASFPSDYFLATRVSLENLRAFARAAAMINVRARSQLPHERVIESLSRDSWTTKPSEVMVRKTRFTKD